jgi:hypothetical protein
MPAELRSRSPARAHLPTQFVATRPINIERPGNLTVVQIVNDTQEADDEEIRAKASRS